MDNKELFDWINTEIESRVLASLLKWPFTITKLKLYTRVKKGYGKGKLKVIKRHIVKENNHDR